MISDSDFLEHLQTAIRENRLTLPTLPEVALKVRDAVERESATAKSIAGIIATDAAMSARILQVANSPLYRRRTLTENIQMAVTRLGNRLVRNLVVSLAMKQIFQPTSDALDRRMRAVWENSIEIAAISRVLAQRLPHLEPEQAMLAGLIHNIGALPVLSLAEGIQEFVEDEARLDNLLRNLTPIIGHQILESWNFPDTLIAVPTHCHDLSYDGGPQADYVDVVLVARLQARPETAPPSDWPDWSQIPAFAKVGLEAEVAFIEIEGVAEEIETVEQMLVA